MEVDKDLLDYVSFLDPVSVAGNFHRPGANSSISSKTKKKKTSTGAYALLVSPPQNSFSVPLAEAQSSTLLSLSVNTFHGHTQEGDISYSTVDRMEDEDIGFDTSNNEIDDSLEIKEEPSQSVAEKVTIEKSHPLMGLWQGSFNVKNIKGQEEEVQETFFLHSTLGAGLLPNLKDLPPEPQFPYCLLKTSKVLRTFVLHLPHLNFFYLPSFRRILGHFQPTTEGFPWVVLWRCWAHPVLTPTTQQLLLRITLILRHRLLKSYPEKC